MNFKTCKKCNIKELTFIIIILILSSCTTERRCNKLFPPKINFSDTIYQEVKEILRDTVIAIKEDSVVLSALIECQADGQLLFKQLEAVSAASKHIKAKIIYKDKIINVICKVDSHNVYLTYKQRFEKQINKSNKVEIVDKKYIPKWLLFLAGFIGAFMLFIGYKFSKML